MGTDINAWIIAGFIIIIFIVMMYLGITAGA
jgi:hypothetical protein